MIEGRELERWKRMLAAMARNADDPESWAEFVDLIEDAQRFARLKADELRKVDGYSWTDLARALGRDPKNRGTVQQRFALRPQDTDRPIPLRATKKANGAWEKRGA